MQLSSKTLQILKNFSAINAGIVIKPGSVITTKAATNSIMGEATVEEVFPYQVSFYDLNQFLGTLSEFQSPEIEFGEKTVTISEASDPRMSFTGIYSPESQIVQLTRSITMPPTPIEFNLTEADFSKLVRMAGIQSFKTITVTKNDEDKIILVASDIENSSTNTFTVVTNSDAPAEDFKMIFAKDSLGILKGDYSVGIAKEGIAKFSNQAIDLVYHIAALDKSYYR